MAHTIQLSDGSTTVNLYDTSSVFVRGWELMSGGSQLDSDESYSLGETLELLIRGANAAAIQSSVSSIERLLEAARRFQFTGVGRKVYLNVQWDGEASLWRSQVLGGKLEVLGAPDQWSRLAIEAELVVTRRNFWEGPETQVNLTNGSGGPSLTQRTIYNHDDGTAGHDNWVTLTGADVVGSIPAPAKIELQNSASNTDNFLKFRFGINAFSDPGNYAAMLQMESFAGGGHTAEANTGASGGQVLRVNTSVSGTATVTVTIPAATVIDLDGRWVRLLLRPFWANAVPFYCIPTLKDVTSTFSLFVGQQVTLMSNLAFTNMIDLGSFPIPPIPNAGAWGDLKLVLRITGPGSKYIELDDLFLFPLDSYRVLDMHSSTLGDTDYIVDNGYDELAYVETSGVRAPLVLPRGDPLLLYPGISQKLYILHDTYYQAPTDNPLKVRVWYRPRRLSI